MYLYVPLQAQSDCAYARYRYRHTEEAAVLELRLRSKVTLLLYRGIYLTCLVDLTAEVYVSLFQV